MTIEMASDWKMVLEDELRKPYFKHIIDFLEEEKKQGKIIFPPEPEIFTAFELTPFADVKVVILGQDPYHNIGQAHGLSFSVRKGIRLPASLKNIFKELQNDLNITLPSNGDLTAWARQGVLLLNAVLTVEKNKPNSHKNIGWEKFTDFVIQQISLQKKGVVFVLWGNQAMKKEKWIDGSRHYILKSPHPSPFSAYSGFFNSKPFSKINQLLIQEGKSPVEWEIKD